MKGRNFMLIRITGGLFLVLSGGLAGVFLCEKLKARANFMGQYVRFLSQAQAVIGYTASSAEEVFRSAGGVPLLRPLLDGAVRLLDDGEELSTAWKRSVDNNVRNRQDRQLLYYFGETFGTSNIEGELSKLSLQRENAERVYNEYLEEVKTKKKLYKTVGLFCGALVAALLI